MSSPEQVEQDRRSAVNTYFQLLQHHTDFIERTHETFNTIESHLYQLIQHYNEELEELPLNTRTRTRNTNNPSRTSTANRTNIRTTRGRSPPSLFNTTNIPTSTMRNPFSSTPLFNELGNSRRRTPAFSPSQNVLDTITLWALFPNGISANNNLESLSPVIVRPTDAQIREATENMRFGDVIDPVNRTCAISQDEFQDDDEITVIRHCGHIFRQSDFQTWFRTNVRCPLCRYDIREYRRGGGGALSRQNSMRRVNSDAGIRGNPNTPSPIQSETERDEGVLLSEAVDEGVGSQDASETRGASGSQGASGTQQTNNNIFSTLGGNNNESFQFYTASNGNNWLDLINENMSRVIQSSDISDNINVNFEYSYIMPPTFSSDLSNNNVP